MMFVIGVLGLAAASFAFGFNVAMYRIADLLSGVEERLESLVDVSDTMTDDAPTDETHPSS